MSLNVGKAGQPAGRRWSNASAALRHVLAEPASRATDRVLTEAFWLVKQRASGTVISLFDRRRLRAGAVGRDASTGASPAGPASANGSETGA